MIAMGLIGCGWIAEKAYLPILTKMNDVEISAVFDTNFQRACEVRTKHRIPNAFDNIDSFLSS